MVSRAHVIFLSRALINTLHGEIRFLTPHLTTTLEEKPMNLHVEAVFSDTLMLKQIRNDDRISCEVPKDTETLLKKTLRP